MLTWNDIDETWVNNNSEILYEYYCNTQPIQPPPFNEYTIYLSQDPPQKCILISFRGVADIIIDNRFEQLDYYLFGAKTLNRFNKYILRKKNIKILLDE